VGGWGSWDAYLDGVVDDLLAWSLISYVGVWIGSDCNVPAGRPSIFCCSWRSFRTFAQAAVHASVTDGEGKRDRDEAYLW
jgi:hypothetical protein